MKAMLLAAGKGTRMGALTEHTPKPLLQVGGVALIVHQIRKLKAAGFTELVINHAWLGAQIETALGNGSTEGVSIQWSREEEPLETAGGIARALALLGSAPFLVVNADVWTDFPFASLRTALQPGDLCHLVLVANPGHHPQGDFGLDARNRLHLLQDIAGPAYTYSGIGVFAPALFQDLPAPRYPLFPLLKQAIASHSASARLYGGIWADIGTEERLISLDRSLACS